MIRAGVTCATRFWWLDSNGRGVRSGKRDPMVSTCGPRRSGREAALYGSEPSEPRTGAVAGAAIVSICWTRERCGLTYAGKRFRFGMTSRELQSENPFASVVVVPALANSARTGHPELGGADDLKAEPTA